MLKEWQFNVLFFVGVGGAVLMLIGPEVGINVGTNPIAVSGVAAILSYVLAQKKALTKSDNPPRDDGQRKEADDDGRSP
jgi:hypothetical protein